MSVRCLSRCVLWFSLSLCRSCRTSAPMAQPDAGVNQGTSYYNSAPAADQNQNVAQDQGDNGVWDDPTWRWGDHWAWWGWHRPYGYRSHWSWGTRAEWSTDGGDFSSGSPGEGDDDWGSGGSTHHTSLQAMTVITQIIVEGLRGILQDFGRGTHLRGLLTLLGMGIQDKRLLPTRVLSAKRWRCQASMHRVLERIWA